jgi:hypothetical protein
MVLSIWHAQVNGYSSASYGVHISYPTSDWFPPGATAQRSHHTWGGAFGTNTELLDPNAHARAIDPRDAAILPSWAGLHRGYRYGE